MTPDRAPGARPPRQQQARQQQARQQQSRRAVRPAPERGTDRAGEVLELEVGPVAHGGHCVSRHEGRVVFVRHALPGERVRARVTEGGDRSSFWRADAVEVLRADADRVAPPCPAAGPGLCGGCDFQHATPARQRGLKADVVREQFARLAGLDVDVVVEPVGEAAADGLRWRTRTRFAVDAEGRPGLRTHRSHDVVRLDDCPISTTGVTGSGVLGERFGNVAGVEVAAGSDGGAPLAVVEGVPGRHAHLPKLPGTSVAVRTDEGVHRVSGRTWVGERITVRGEDFAYRVGGAGFWQGHRDAPRVLAEAVLDALEPRPGERAVDLYAGAGLFTAVLAAAVGPEGSVLAVEGEERAVRDARKSLLAADRPHEHVELWAGAVGEALADPELAAADLVVLDPPRSGAGADVVRGVVALGARAVAYVACDPAALARDTASFAEHGYVLDGLRALDLFPMTHHVECVARFVPRGGTAAPTAAG